MSTIEKIEQIRVIYDRLDTDIRLYLLSILLKEEARKQEEQENAK